MNCLGNKEPMIVKAEQGTNDNEGSDIDSQQYTFNYTITINYNRDKRCLFLFKFIDKNAKDLE